MDSIFEIIIDAIAEILGGIIEDKDTGIKTKIISIMILVIPVLLICGFIVYEAVKTFSTDKPVSFTLFAVAAFLIGICIYAVKYNIKKK